MLHKQLELPPEVSKAFVRDMRAYFKGEGEKQAGRDCRMHAVPRY
jgi:hypothetical protein